MSYLHLPAINLADFSKGTISLWFRFSSDSIAHAIAHSINYPLQEGAPTVLKGVIPLITFGRSVMAHCYGSAQKIVGEVPAGAGGGGGTPVYATTPVDLGDQPCPPSHIGIDCTQDVDAALVMFFQTATRAVVQGLVHETMSVTFENIGSETFPIYQQKTVVQDVSYIRVGQPESFLINPKFNVAADRWHHVLVSFDFSHAIDVIAIQDSGGTFQEGDGIQGTGKFYYALDDENRNGANNMGDAWAFKGSNDVVTQSARLADFGYIPQDDPNVTGGTENPEYHWTASPLAMNGGPVGLPASSGYVETVYHCEQAELQFFAGLVLDTSDVSNRRAFVDASGKPVKPDETKRLLGRRPDILLHKTSNWKAGKNTGATGTDSEGKIIAAGQFTPTGQIEKYTPDPSL